MSVPSLDVRVSMPQASTQGDKVDLLQQIERCLRSVDISGWSLHSLPCDALVLLDLLPDAGFEIGVWSEQWAVPVKLRESASPPFVRVHVGPRDGDKSDKMQRAWKLKELLTKMEIAVEQNPEDGFLLLSLEDFEAALKRFDHEALDDGGMPAREDSVMWSTWTGVEEAQTVSSQSANGTCFKVVQVRMTNMTSLNERRMLLKEQADFVRKKAEDQEALWRAEAALKLVAVHPCLSEEVHYRQTQQCGRDYERDFIEAFFGSRSIEWPQNYQLPASSSLQAVYFTSVERLPNGLEMKLGQNLDERVEGIVFSFFNRYPICEALVPQYFQGEKASLLNAYFEMVNKEDGVRAECAKHLADLMVRKLSCIFEGISGVRQQVLGRPTLQTGTEGRGSLAVTKATQKQALKYRGAFLLKIQAVIRELSAWNARAERDVLPGVVPARGIEQDI